ncbi:CheY-like superfamily [Kalaharituber pfeilii]|nr:CheY-like superfamily [Kalaharituber pfeilii]
MKRSPLPSRYTGLSCSRPILLIDDDPLCRRLLILFFNSMKQEVDWASDGITAIEKINHHRYSIIYMDPIMPYLDGVSTARLIRESDQEILIPSNTALDDASVYKRSGMNAVLAKPLEYKKIYNSMIKGLPDIPEWSLPRNLRPKRYSIKIYTSHRFFKQAEHPARGGN